jgi:SpoVK/Ycf46/Vps4 family AAA+-type ATPase
MTASATSVRHTKAVPATERDVAPFTNSIEHILAEISRVELLVRWQIEQMHHGGSPSGELKGLVISDDEVADLLKRAQGSPPFAAAPPTGEAKELWTAIREISEDIAERLEASLAQHIGLRLVTLQQTFLLSDFEIACLVVCLAVEVDPRYERLYAYLQDDVTKKYASLDLVLNLACHSLEEKILARERFVGSAPLIRHRLLHTADDPSRTGEPMLARALRVDERISRYLLDSDTPDPLIASFAQCVEPGAMADDAAMHSEILLKLRELTVTQSSSVQVSLLYFHGPYGAGLQATAEALCTPSHASLLCVDLDALLAAHANGANAALGLAIREAMLRGSVLYLDGFDLLLAEDKAALRRSLLRELDVFRGLVILAGETAWQPHGELRDREFISVEFSRPDFASRSEQWRKELGPDISPELDCTELANKFRMTEGQIHDAVRSARQFARWRDPLSLQISMGDLYEACRVHSGRKLSSLGRRIKPRHHWDDLILPEDRARHLREICNSVKYRSVVFDQWGFDGKLSLGKGLNMLFAGPSGTGKTMAAEIMAGELGLDVYKIDLSSIVSKYIGETEKNLSRIFAEAETSNAILFFDEADALFGKRSEVRDAHDRYANIEINYLLQKMEEHEGVVILATNFRKNMDDAFVRRLHFTVEFPFPNEADRRRIWERIWPKETPQSADLDFGFMARRFEMPGGNIRNVALAAAFLAASDGGVVTMSHLLHGTRREFQKMGKVVSQGEFM